jgi:hypothetical protein
MERIKMDGKLELKITLTITKADGTEFQLTKGDEVLIFTDDTDYEKEYSGVITYIDDERIEIESAESIPWNYIIDIDMA